MLYDSVGGVEVHCEDGGVRIRTDGDATLDPEGASDIASSTAAAAIDAARNGGDGR
jgi:hypothetical protein